MAPVCLIDATGSKDFLKDRSLQAGGKRHNLLLTAANSQHNSHFVAVVAGGLPYTCIVEDVSSHHKGHQLCYVGDFQNVRWKSELHRVKVDVGDEAAAPAIGLVGAFFVGRVVVIDIPSGKRHVHDGVELCGDIFPVLLQVSRIGKNTGHANNCNRMLLQPRVHFRPVFKVFQSFPLSH